MSYPTARCLRTLSSTPSFLSKLRMLAPNEYLPCEMSRSGPILLESFAKASRSLDRATVTRKMSSSRLRRWPGSFSSFAYTSVSLCFPLAEPIGLFTST